MSSGRSNGGSVPQSAKKMVQSLKEIVNCPELEIYAMLKDCNMDPNEAVNRLLSQDPFHEVKSKREKKKEPKDVYDSRSRGVSSTSTRGGRGGDRYSNRGSAAQFGSSDSGASRAKPVYKKDNGPAAYSSSGTGMTGYSMNRRQPSVSDATTDNSYSTNAATENISPALPSTGFQSAWGGMAAGQVSMADIVKMGRPQPKPSNNLHTSQQHVHNQQHASVPPGVPGPHDLPPSQNYGFKGSEMNLETGATVSQHAPPNDDWTLEEEPPAASISSVVEPSFDSEHYSDHYDRTNQQFRTHQSDEVRYVEDDDTGDDTHADFAQSAPESNRDVQENNSGGVSGFENDLYQNINAYQVPHREEEDAGVHASSVATDFQNLSLAKEDEDSPSEDEGPAVKIPDHLQVQSADCSHLSFGSFGSGMNAPFSGSFGSRAVQQSNEEEATVAADAPSVGHSEATRNHEYYEEEHLQAASEGNAAHRMGSDSGNFDTPSVSQQDMSQPDMLKQEAPEVAPGSQYSFPSSTVNYGFENSQQLNASYAHSQTGSQMQGLPSMSGVTAYSNSLPSTLLASNMQQPLREAELAYSPFPISQQMPTKYSNNSVSSLSGPNASVAEAIKSGNFPTNQPTQTLQGGGGLPQHLLNPYTQPSVPLGPPFAAVSYPFLHQSYPYMPSAAFQQAFAAAAAAGNHHSNYPQSLAAAVLPQQYKNSVSVSSLGTPQSASAVASGYGAAGFGNSSSVLPGNFPLNPPTAPAGTSMSYDDVLSSQYKDASHLLSLQQGPGSRTMSGVPGSTYYSFQGQTQQPPAGFRQTQQQQQQPSQQHYAQQLSGYPNYYHSQAGPTLEQQLQMSRDGSLGGAQQQQPKQNPPQLWQNSY